MMESELLIPVMLTDLADTVMKTCSLPGGAGSAILSV